MRTEQEIREHIKMIAKLREEIMSLSKDESPYQISVAAIDGALNQLEWVLGAEGTWTKATTQ